MLLWAVVTGVLDCCIPPWPGGIGGPWKDIIVKFQRESPSTPNRLMLLCYTEQSFWYYLLKLDPNHSCLKVEIYGQHTKMIIRDKLNIAQVQSECQICTVRIFLFLKKYQLLDEPI